MHDQHLLIDIAIVLSAAFPLLFIAARLKLPAIISYLIAGILIGPFALRLIHETRDIEFIAEIGVALILFFIGLEIPLSRLRALGRTTVISGSLQMALTALAVAAIVAVRGGTFRLGLFYGFLIALGSTAVVLPILASRDEMGAPFARRFLGVSLFQDLAVIPLMLLVPAFASGGRDAVPLPTLAVRVGVAIVGVIALVLIARIVVPRLLHAISALGSREAFTGTVVVLIVGTIAIAERLGISAALGAFAAGVVVAESDFIHEVEAVLRPFRDFLAALFFASIGMLLNPAFVIGNAGAVTFTVLLVVAVKVTAAYAAFRAGGSKRRTAIRASFAIAPIGEFSFLLAQAGKRAGIVDARTEQMFVAVAVITLASTPLLVRLGLKIADRMSEPPEKLDDEEPPLRGHIIVVGYGLNGQNVASVLAATGIPHVVLDEDIDRVAAARASGSRTIVADAADPEALKAAGIADARAVIVAISDADGTRRIVRLARSMNRDGHIIVRTRYVKQVEALREAGADEVIPEEFETSLEIVTRTLRLLAVPGNVIASQLRVLRDEGYRLLRDPRGRAMEGRRLAALLTAGTAQTYLIMPGSNADGKTLDELELEEEHVGVAALLRNGQALAPVPREEPLRSGDMMVLVGAHEDLTRVLSQLEH